jgi:maltooligosyltrehalose trehalohydrolase
VKAELWAPDATTVDIESGGERRPLRRDDRGWWRDASGRDVDDSYWFVVDGERIPDPRSPAQPEGLEGPSHPDDAAGFAWTDGDWSGAELARAVIYETHIGTFTADGTFDSAINRLDHLVRLGVTAVEVMPINTFPGRWGWGYDGALLYAPQWSYGGPDGFRRFVDACHARSFAVVLDVVYNHLGPTGNHLAKCGPYFTDAHRTPWGDGINLDGRGSDEVRRFIIDNAVRWITDFHVDGLRLDAVHALTDRTAIHILEELAADVHVAAVGAGRRAVVIAESDLNDPRLVTSPDRGGYGLDAMWSDDFHHGIHVALTGERDGYYADYSGWDDVVRCLERAYKFDGIYSAGRGRRHGRPAGSLPRRQFLGYSQTHDQVGNRAMGERLAHLVDSRRAQIAAALVLTSPFTPMLFQGEEWAASSPFQFFTDHQEPELANAVREGRRREFESFTTFSGEEVPDPQDEATYRRSILDWSELDRPPHAEMLAWYRALLGLRAASPDLRTDGAGDTAATHDPAGGWLRIRRGHAVVAVNVGDHATEVPLDGLDVVVALANGDARVADDAIELAPWTVAVCLPLAQPALSAKLI